MFELRYLVQESWNGTQKRLQYRQKINITDYSIKNIDGSYMSNTVWTSWEDVPEVEIDIEN
jgi:hypothetical protein